METKKPRERQTPANNVLFGILTILGALFGVMTLMMVVIIMFGHNI